MSSTIQAPLSVFLPLNLVLWRYTVHIK